MDTRPTVVVSSPQRKNLSDRQLALVDDLTSRVDAAGIRVGRDSSDTDRLEERFEGMCRCQGVIVLALAQWEARRLHRSDDKVLVFPSEFTHLASTMAVASRKPLLVLQEKSVA